MKFSVILATALLYCAWVPATYGDDALAGALEQVSKSQVEAFNRADIDAALAYAHSKSPTYETARDTMTEYFKNQKLAAEQLSFQYIGHDDEFALARVKVKVTSPGTEGFQPIVTDTVTLFHQEDGNWKVWDAYLIGGRIAQ